MTKNNLYHTSPQRLYLAALVIFTLLAAFACRLGPLTGTPASPTVRQVTQPLPTLTESAPISVTAIPSPTAAPSETAAPPTASPTPASLRFAVIGDFGEGNQAELDVSNLVKSWQPEFIITVGDNNYPSGAAETIDDRIGKYYQEFIFPYKGAFGTGADTNRFFPTLGNHDWDTARAQAYFDYFTLPGNERYYDFIWGPVHFFAVSSDSREPDGVSSNSVQAQWLQQSLAVSAAPWQIVYFHQPPYSSGYHGPVNWMRWPFAAWGADAVLAGHDHVYERLLVDGIPYFINGLGGGPIYSFLIVDPQSQARYNDDYGAMLVVADAQQIVFQFINRRGEVIDAYTIER